LKIYIGFEGLNPLSPLPKVFLEEQFLIYFPPVGFIVSS
jgi:hypothetical protein